MLKIPVQTWQAPANRLFCTAMVTAPWKLFSNQNGSNHYLFTDNMIQLAQVSISGEKGENITICPMAMQNYQPLGFTEKTSFWPRLLVGCITANGWLATASHMMKMKKNKRLLTYSFDQATFAYPHCSTNQDEMITQETNPVFWVCTH